MRIKTTVLLLVLSLGAGVLGSCRTGGGTGAAVGAGVGAGAGALLDGGNRWRGAAIGAAVGGLAGYAIGDTIEENERDAAYTAAQENRVVVREIRDTESNEEYRVRAEPAPYYDDRGSYGGEQTRVTTTVSKWNPSTQRWETVSERDQYVD